jgi:hypothetical protein
MKTKPSTKRLTKEEQEVYDQQKPAYLTRWAALILAGVSVITSSLNYCFYDGRILLNTYWQKGKGKRLSYYNV